MNKANYQVSGKVHMTGEIQTIPTKKGDLLKKTIVLEVPVNKGAWERTNFVCFETFNNGVYTLDQFEVGDDVEVDFTMKSNQGKKNPDQWFTSLYLQGITRQYFRPEVSDEPDVTTEIQETKKAKKLNGDEDGFEDLFAKSSDKLEKPIVGKYDDLILKKPKIVGAEFDWSEQSDDLPF